MDYSDDGSESPPGANSSLSDRMEVVPGNPAVVDKATSVKWVKKKQEIHASAINWLNLIESEEVDLEDDSVRTAMKEFHDPQQHEDEVRNFNLIQGRLVDFQQQFANLPSQIPIKAPTAAMEELRLEKEKMIEQLRLHQSKPVPATFPPQWNSIIDNYNGTISRLEGDIESKDLELQNHHKEIKRVESEAAEKDKENARLKKEKKELEEKLMGISQMGMSEADKQKYSQMWKDRPVKECVRIIHKPIVNRLADMKARMEKSLADFEWKRKKKDVDVTMEDGPSS